MEQFWLPRDEEILQGIPNLGLHSILRYYLVRRCLVEHEMHSHLAQAHKAFKKVLGQVEAQRTGENANLEEAIKQQSVKKAEMDDWGREMRVKEEMIEKLKASEAQKLTEIHELRCQLDQSGEGVDQPSAVLEERDLAVMQVAVEKQITQHAKAKLEEELIAKGKLQEECAQLRESLSVVESKHISH